MKHLIIDGMNFMHRARAGFQMGPHPLMFNFYRNLRAQVDFHKPDHVHFILEGHPKARHDALPEYKANRKVDADDPEMKGKVDEMARFFEGYSDVLELMMKSFPITVARHPDHECDDVVHNLALRIVDTEVTDGEPNEAVIVSSDTDFIQSLQVHPNIKLYNAMKKEFVTPPPYNYVMWKALRGDGSDNIPGIPGVGDKTAVKLVTGDLTESLLPFLLKDSERGRIFDRNTNLIKFVSFSDEEWRGVASHTGVADWSRVKEVFDSYGFKSITDEKPWKKFTETFDRASK